MSWEMDCKVRGLSPRATTNLLDDHLFIHSLDKQISTYYGSGTMIGSADILNKSFNLFFHSLIQQIVNDYTIGEHCARC